MIGLERTDNNMDLTTWPQVHMINQKNYYTWVALTMIDITKVIVFFDELPDVFWAFGSNFQIVFGFISIVPKSTAASVIELYLRHSSSELMQGIP